ncbi:MAG: hypothetical protein ABIG94_09305 [Pseudomonadota bacterium]
MLWDTIRQGWVWLVSLVLCAHQGPGPLVIRTTKSKTIPYGAALALGMTFLCWRWQNG